MKSATVHLWVDTDFSRATARALGPQVNHLVGRTAILPSSQDPKDAFVGLVGAALPESTESFIAIPVTGAAARRAFLTPGVLGRWLDRPASKFATNVSNVSLPQDLAQADQRIIVTDVVEVARKGPFVLDLTARYIHPRQRMRLLASGQREALAAEVASAMAVEQMVIYLAQREGVVVAVSQDMIAAELIALAMSELCMGAPRSFTGPWEDPVVQRATELEMGVLLPNRIRLISDGPERQSHWAQRVLDHVQMRLGLTG